MNTTRTVVVDHALWNGAEHALEAFGRRNFLRLTGLAAVGFGFAASTKNVFAQSTEPAVWREAVARLIYTVAGCERLAEYLVSQLNQTPLYRAAVSNELHDYYSSPLVFGKPHIDPRRVICDNGFHVNRLPFYDAEFPCRDFNDLNHPEIQTVTDPGEIHRFGCVLTPDGPRTQFERSDHAHYHELAERYSINTSEWEVPSYKRRLRSHARAHTGYHIIHKTETRYGKPKTDFIVSKDI